MAPVSSATHARGADRPDQISDTTKVVAGPVCHSVDPVNGLLSYCCTDIQTDCGYDPRVLCTDSAYGFSCMGTNRPNSYDAVQQCGEGVHEYGLISYCCGQNVPVGNCARNTSVPCSNATLGFSCSRPDQIPTETDLGMNQSRSEVPLICSLSAPNAITTGLTDYCCYTPSSAPPGYSCLQNQIVGLVDSLDAVPGCQAGQSFGFACLGTDDTPEVDYPRMACDSAPVAVSVRQTNLWLYCCNYSLMP